MDNSKENLEKILTGFAHKICDRYGIFFSGGGFVLHLEEEMFNDTVMLAGNPVQIKIHWRLLADAMEHNKMSEFKQHLQRCLEVAASRMLYTLSNTPPAPIVAKDSHERYWKKKKLLKEVMPHLIDTRRVAYEVHISVTARDKRTGKVVHFCGDEEEGASIESLKRLAHRTLTEELLNERRGNAEAARETEARDGNEDGGASTPDGRETERNQAGTEETRSE